MKKKIIPGDLAKEQLLEGAKILYDAVSTTLGPKGQNGVIEAYGEPIVTHDGVTVAKSIEDVEGVSPGARVGIEMIKASSSRTNDNVGDGTTSSTILAYHLMDGGMQRIKGGKNAMMLRRELDFAAEKVLSKLPSVAEEIKTEKATIEIATIASENADIGKEVGKMYHKLGKDGMVVVEMGQKTNIEYEIIEGYTFDKGLLSPMMVLDPRTGSTTLKKPRILVCHQTVSKADVASLVEEVYNSGADNLVIVAEDFKNDLLDAALQQLGEFNVIGIKSPGFGEQRIELLRDIAAFVGTEAVGAKLAKKISDLKLDDLGTCDELVATQAETIITGGKDVKEYTKTLQANLKSTKGEFDKSKIERRISQLRAQVGQIRVGGNTEMEAEERKYLIDDAVAATEAALKEGVVPGAGMTYIRLASELDPAISDGESLLKESLPSVFKVLMTNAGLRYGKQLEKLEGRDFGVGFDILENPEEPVDLKARGIIDPALVIKQTITNAVSVAGSALTTGVIIAREEEKDDKETV